MQGTTVKIAQISFASLRNPEIIRYYVVRFFTRIYKVKIKVTLVQALRICTVLTAHKGNRDIALLFLDHGTRRGEGPASRPGRSLLPCKDPVPIVQEAG